MKKYLLFLFVLFNTFSSFSQGFLKTYTSTFIPSPNCTIQMQDSGFISAGYKTFGSNQELTLTRFDESGNIIWDKYIFENYFSTEYPRYLKQISTNRILLVANRDYQIALALFDTLGNLISYRQLAQLSGSNIAVSERKNDVYYISTGSSVIQIDTLGNVKWQKRYLLYNNSPHLNIYNISKNRVILIGYVNSGVGYASGTDITMLIIDSLGNVQSRKTFGSDYPETVINSVITNDFKIVVQIKRTYSTNDGIFLMAIDTLGNQLWISTLDEYADNPYNSIKIINDGSIIAAGKNSANSEVILRKLNSNGQTILMKKILINNPGNFDILPCFNNELLLTYQISTTSRGMLKLNSNLNTPCFSEDEINHQFGYVPFLLEANSFTLTYNNYTNNTNITCSIQNSSTVPASTCLDNCNLDINFIADKYKTCLNDNINFINSSDTSLSFQWFKDDVLSSTGYNYNSSFNIPGSHTIKVVATNGSCSDTNMVQITIDTMPDPQFTYIKNNLVLTLQPLINSDYSEWEFGDGSKNESGWDTLQHYYKHVGTYEVCLNAENSCGQNSKCNFINLVPELETEFVRVYDEIDNGNQYGGHAIQSADGGYIFMGVDDSYGATGWSGVLLKTDYIGEPNWTKIIDFPDHFYGEHVTECYNGEMILSSYDNQVPAYLHFGRVKKDGTNNSFLRISSNTFEKTAPPLELKNHDLILSGTLSGQGFVMQTSRNFEVRWFKKYSGLKTIHKTVEVNDGFYLIGSDNGNTKIALMKINFNGNISWVKNYNLGGSCVGMDMTINSNNELLITGYVNISGNKTAVLKTDSLGNVIWSKYFSLIGQSNGRSITTNEINEIFITTTKFDYSSSNSEHALIKLSDNGNLIWGWIPNSCSVFHTNAYDNGIILGTTKYSGSFLEYSTALIKINGDSIPSCFGNPTSPVSTTITPVITSFTGTIDSTIPAITKFTTIVNYNIADSLICSAVDSVLMADFITTNNCSPEEINFNNLSVGSYSNLLWNFPSGTPSTSTVENPIISYSSPGNYTVTLSVFSPTDTSTYSQNITIYPAPMANAGSDSMICSGDTIQLSGISSGTGIWNSNNSLQDVNDLNTLVYPISNQSYILQTTDVSGCVAFDTVDISIFPVPDAGPNLAVCPGTSIALQSSGSVSNSHWSPSTFLNDSTLFSPISTPNNDITYHLEAAYGMGCTYYDSMSVTIFSNPQASLTNTQICQDDTVSISMVNSISCQWSPNVFISSDQDCFVDLFPQSSGTYYVLYTDSNNCDWDDSIYIDVFSPGPAPVLSISGDSLISSPSSFNYQWFLDGTILPGQNSNIISFINSGIYSACYQDSNGCWSDTASVTVMDVTNRIENNLEVYPNPTTSEVLISSSSAIFTLSVFDATGKLILSSKNLNGNSHSIDLRKLERGIYFIHVQTDRGISVVKVVKE